MSSKASGLVWDLECPKKYGEILFRPMHKYILAAYADHANHEGKNIWPAVKTVSKKTGLDERTVQRLTNDLEAIGLLVEDGQGPRGTNKWYLPYDDRGWQVAPPSNCQGDKSEDSLGDIPSGDIPSGGRLPPELKEPEPDINNSEEKDSLMEIISQAAYSIFTDITLWRSIEKILERDSVQIIGDADKKPDLDDPMKIVISGLIEKPKGGQFTLAHIWADRFTKSFANQGIAVTFQE